MATPYYGHGYTIPHGGVGGGGVGAPFGVPGMGSTLYAHGGMPFHYGGTSQGYGMMGTERGMELGTGGLIAAMAGHLVELRQQVTYLYSQMLAGQQREHATTQAGVKLQADFTALQVKVAKLEASLAAATKAAAPAAEKPVTPAQRDEPAAPEVRPKAVKVVKPAGATGKTPVERGRREAAPPPPKGVKARGAPEPTVIATVTSGRSSLTVLKSNFATLPTKLQRLLLAALVMKYGEGHYTVHSADGTDNRCAAAAAVEAFFQRRVGTPINHATNAMVGANVRLAKQMIADPALFDKVFGDAAAPGGDSTTLSKAGLRGYIVDSHDAGAVEVIWAHLTGFNLGANVDVFSFGVSKGKDECVCGHAASFGGDAAPAIVGFFDGHCHSIVKQTCPPLAPTSAAPTTMVGKYIDGVLRSPPKDLRGLDRTAATDIMIERGGEVAHRQLLASGKSTSSSAPTGKPNAPAGTAAAHGAGSSGASSGNGGSGGRPTASANGGAGRGAAAAAARKAAAAAREAAAAAHKAAAAAAAARKAGAEAGGTSVDAGTEAAEVNDDNDAASSHSGSHSGSGGSRAGDGSDSGAWVPLETVSDGAGLADLPVMEPRLRSVSSHRATAAAFARLTQSPRLAGASLRRSPIHFGGDAEQSQPAHPTGDVTLTQPTYILRPRTVVAVGPAPRSERSGSRPPTHAARSSTPPRQSSRPRTRPDQSGGTDV